MDWPSWLVQLAKPASARLDLARLTSSATTAHKEEGFCRTMRRQIGEHVAGSGNWLPAGSSDWGRSLGA
jgi:hypothetical protein